MKRYACYIGMNESQRQEFTATSILQLRKQLGRDFGLWGRWYKQKSLDWNTKKFLVVHKGRRENITIILMKEVV